MAEDDDEMLLEELAAMVASADPVPGHWIDAAHETLAWRDVDAELARLVQDSASTSAAPAGLRAGSGSGPASTSGPRRLTFATDDRLLEVELVTGDDGLTVVGQIVPAQPGTITVHQPARPGRTVTADDIGRFRVDGLPIAPLGIHVAGAPAFWTGAIIL